MSTRPSAIRTFLIADIRGYTRFTDQFGDEAASRLATTFAQIVAEAMEAWDGRLVELRGDEALCTFDSPRAALRCAMELQQVFAEEASGSPELPLHVGMGLDVGEAVPVGDGYRGAALNLAARLCSGAAAGEIRATQNLAHVAGPIPGVVYEPQGTEQLKGIAADMAIVRVRGTQENASTPLVGRPSGRSPEPLPAELESAVPLVGREADLLWLRWHWRRARHGHGGAVEVVGPQGIGKSRLVAELARLAHSEGALVSLAPVSEADGPTLVVLEDVDRTPVAAPETIGEVELRAERRPVLAVLTRRQADGAGRPCRVLEPLTEADVTAITALYANEPGEPAPARRILAESGGIPLAIHRIAGQWARTAAMHRMGESARRTSRERRGLREAEEELIGHFADLELTRERARMYGSEGPAASGVCPYKGLAAYEAADAEYYFGREQLIGELVARVVGSSFVGLVGASGSGKSSVLSAGLLPALANGVLPGSKEWIQVPMRPGSQPMRHLAEALRRAAPATTSESDAEEILDRLAATMAPAQRMLLVIDQFEEVFTADESERERFLGLITDARPSTKVVLAVRADQYERCAVYPRLARLLAADQVLVGPIGRDEVAAIARHPAERVGLRVEPELIEALIADLGTEPGAMPLLSTALLELWEAREGGRLTLAAYRTTGGVQGAVARLAESAYARLEPEEQDAARSLFMRLVGEGSEPETIVRRRLSMDELDTIGDPRIGTVVEKLTTGRLLTRDEGTAEVAHEALIREWPRLREWIEADAAGRQVRLRLIESARSWDAGGRGEEDLYRGARLAAALEWSTERTAELNAVERDFLDASRESAEREEVRQRRTNRILRGLLAGAGVLLLAAVGAGVVAFVQAGENAENASMSQVRELSLSALSLTSDDPQLALLLAAEAVELSREAGREPPASTLQALWSAYVAGKSTTTIPGAGARAIAYSPDGTVLVVDAPESPDLLVTLRDPSSGEQVGAITRTEEVGDVERLAFSPNGRWLAVATSGPAGAGQGSVSIFEASSRDLVHRVAGGHDGYRELFLTDAGLLAAAGTTSGQREIGIMAWDVASAEERAIISTVPGISSSDLSYLQPLSVAIDPSDGQLIVGVASEFTANGLGSFVGALNVGDELLRCPPCTGTRPAWLQTVELLPDLVAPSPDGLHIAVADFTRGRVMVIDALLGAPVFEPVSYRNPRSVEWSPDSSRLLVTGGDNPTVFDATNGTVLLTLPSRGETSSAASFRPETDEIAVVSGSGGFRVHRTTPTGGDIATAGIRVARALAAGGTHFLTGQEVVGMGITTEHMVVSIAAAGVAVFDRETGANLHSRDFEIEVGLPAAVAKDAGTVAGIYPNGSVSVLETATLRDAARLPGCAAPTGSSADGRFFVLDRSLGIGDACAAGDGVAGVFDVENDALTIEFGSERIVHGAVSNAGSNGTRYAALAVYEDPAKPGRVDLWDIESATLVASLDQAARPGILPTFVSFSPDARYLAVGTNGPGAVVLDVPALADGADFADAIVFDREVHASRAPRAILTDDGVLATGSGDGVYRFWDLQTGEMTMQLETTGVLGAGVFDFSPDFSSFYYEDGGGIIRQMPTEIDQLVETATSMIGRSLTDAECRDYLHLDACGPADD